MSDVRLPPAFSCESLLPEGDGQAPEETTVSGRIVEMYGDRLFLVRERGTEREIVVLAPRPLMSMDVGSTVLARGTLRRLAGAELERLAAAAALPEPVRQLLRERSVLVATSVLATRPGAEPQPVEPEKERPPERGAALPAKLPLTVRATTLAAHIEELSGLRVRVLNARVVGVLEPNALLIEPATTYLKPMGQRDRVLVLIEAANLRVPPERLVASVVRVVGVARTLLGLQVTAEVPWPAKLGPEAVRRLEVRAAVLATSVQTAEGTELTDRPIETPK
ncbi:MAG TPA: hypothetical protein VNK92_03675, partial [Vicinamibacterales bacterium]|nr:hypothetical protein [Vicinamibacterales bacterium]